MILSKRVERTKNALLSNILINNKTLDTYVYR
jgi:hypothetical protein